MEIALPTLMTLALNTPERDSQISLAKAVSNYPKIRIVTRGLEDHMPLFTLILVNHLLEKVFPRMGNKLCDYLLG